MQHRQKNIIYRKNYYFVQSIEWGGRTRIPVLNRASKHYAVSITQSFSAVVAELTMRLTATICFPWCRHPLNYLILIITNNG
jgi:hypothetical protein